MHEPRSSFLNALECGGPGCLISTMGARALVSEVSRRGAPSNQAFTCSRYCHVEHHGGPFRSRPDLVRGTDVIATPTQPTAGSARRRQLHHSHEIQAWHACWLAGWLAGFAPRQSPYASEQATFLNLHGHDETDSVVVDCPRVAACCLSLLSPHPE